MKTFICIIMAFVLLLFVVHTTAFSDDAPEWLYQRHYVDVENTRYFLEFYPVPVGPGHNFNAWMAWQERTHFSPQPPVEYLFLGPVIYHGGDLRMGGMLDGYNFVRSCESTSSLWFFRDGVELQTEEP